MILLLGLYAAKILYWFRDVDLFSPYPLVNVDYVQYYGRVLRAHIFLSQSGRIWGYDPFDMAGYLSGPFLEVGIQFNSLVCHFLSPIMSIRTSLLLQELIGLIAAPFLAIFAARAFGASRKESWIAFALVILLHGNFEAFSHMLHRIGLYGFQMASFVALVQVGFMWRWAEVRDLKTWAAFAAVSAVLFQLHPASLIIVGPACVWIYARAAKQFRSRDHGMLFLAAFLTIAANWYWMHPFIAFRDWKYDAPYFVTEGWKEIWKLFNPMEPSFYFSIRTILNVAMASLAFVSISRLWRTRRALALFFLFWIFWLGLVSYFGSSFPGTKTLQPGRNSFALWLVIYMVASFSVDEFVFLHPVRRSIAGGLVAVCVAYLFFGRLDQPYQLVPSLKTQLEPWQTIFIEYLKEKPPMDGRLLVECNDRWDPNFADIIPFHTKQLLLGGQHPGNFLKARFSVFAGDRVVPGAWLPGDPVVFNRRLKELPEAEFSKYLDLYHVREIAVLSNTSKSLLDAYTTALEPGATVGSMKIYRVRKGSAWFIEGSSGTVSMDYDRIVISNAAKGPLTLKAHWIKTFKTDPSLPIEPVFIHDDPVPFIRIDNSTGVDTFMIYNAGLKPFRLH